MSRVGLIWGFLRTRKKAAGPVAQNVKTERALPHNLEVERSILGAVLLDNHAFNSAAQIVTAEDFFGDSNSVIYAAMSTLSERNAGIDPITLRAELERADTLDRAGGAAYISSLIDGMPTGGNVEQYARLVKEKASLRALIGTRSSRSPKPRSARASCRFATSPRTP